MARQWVVKAKIQYDDGEKLVKEGTFSSELDALDFARKFFTATIGSHLRDRIEITITQEEV